MALIEVIGNLLRGQISEKIADRQAKDDLRGRVPYAEFGLRVGAFVIDNLILSVVIFPLQILMGNSGVFLAMIVILLYFSIMESMAGQATFGKKFLGLRVTDLNERPISVGKAFARNFSKIISLGMFGIGYLFPIFTEKRQTVHDIIAGCLVLKAGSPAPRPTRIPSKAPPTPRP